LDLYSYGQSRELAKQALTYRSTRQDLIASNLANVNTPYYRPRDINFEDTMAREASKIFKQREELPVANTNSYHFDSCEFEDFTKPEVFFRDGHMAKNDGNSVDLDVETTEMAKNGTMYNALINAIKKDSMIMRGVIESSAKV
jgi:flagellar basal-body rod protein FlgB